MQWSEHNTPERRISAQRAPKEQGSRIDKETFLVTITLTHPQSSCSIKAWKADQRLYSRQSSTFLTS